MCGWTGWRFLVTYREGGLAGRGEGVSAFAFGGSLPRRSGSFFHERGPPAKLRPPGQLARAWSPFRICPTPISRVCNLPCRASVVTALHCTHLGYKTGLLFAPADMHEFVLAGHRDLAALSHEALIPVDPTDP